MEYLKVHINEDLFKLPVPHERLKELVKKKNNLTINDVEKFIDSNGLYLRRTDSEYFNVISNKTNIFVLNFYLGLLKSNGTININSFVKSDNESLLSLIQKLIKIPLSYDELIQVMNNHEYIKELTLKYKKQKQDMIKEKTRKNTIGGFSIAKLRENQRIKDEE